MSLAATAPAWAASNLGKFSFAAGNSGIVPDTAPEGVYHDLVFDGAALLVQEEGSGPAVVELTIEFAPHEHALIDSKQFHWYGRTDGPQVLKDWVWVPELVDNSEDQVAVALTYALPLGLGEQAALSGRVASTNHYDSLGVFHVTFKANGYEDLRVPFATPTPAAP